MPEYSQAIDLVLSHPKLFRLIVAAHPIPTILPRYSSLLDGIHNPNRNLYADLLNRYLPVWDVDARETLLTSHITVQLMLAAAQVAIKRRDYPSSQISSRIHYEYAKIGRAHPNLATKLWYPLQHTGQQVAHDLTRLSLRTELRR